MHAKKGKFSSTCLVLIDFDTLVDAPLPPSSDKLREVNRVLSTRLSSNKLFKKKKKPSPPRLPTTFINNYQYSSSGSR